jgi:hypothetical protein
MTVRRATAVPSTHVGGFDAPSAPSSFRASSVGRLKGAEPAAGRGTFAGLSPPRPTQNRRFRTSLVTTGRFALSHRGRQVVGCGRRSTVPQAPAGFVVGGISRTITLAPPLRWRCTPAPWSRLPTPPPKKIPGGRQFFWLQGGSSLAAVVDHARGLTPRSGGGGPSAPPATLTRGRSGGSGPSTTALVSLENGATVLIVKGAFGC